MLLNWLCCWIAILEFNYIRDGAIDSKHEGCAKMGP